MRAVGQMQAVVFDVGYDADYLAPRLALRAEPDSFAQRFFVRPNAARHSPVDDDDGRSVRVISFGEGAAFDQSYAHRLEVTRVDDVTADQHPILRRGAAAFDFRIV